MVADPIAELRSPAGALISMYIERPSPGGFSALIADLGRTVREAARSRARTVQKSVESDINMIREEAERFEIEAVPAYAIFASAVDGIFEIKALAHPVRSRAVLGSRPYLRPLRAAPRPSKTGVMIADRSEARVFVGYDGSIQELGKPLRTEIGKSNYGGFSGYEERTVRGRADEMAARLWREAGQRLLDRHLDVTFDSLLVGGHEESLEEIKDQLHPYLRGLPLGFFQVSPSEVAMTRIRSEIDEQNRRLREQRERDVVSKVMAAAKRGSGGVLGLAEALRASNVQAISDLVVAGSFTRPGVMCPSCGYLDRAGEKCPVCASSMHGVPDVVAALIDATVDAGGTVHQVVVGSALDREGVGALTRFDVGELN